LTFIAWLMLLDAGRVFDVQAPHLGRALLNTFLVNGLAVAIGMRGRIWRALLMRRHWPTWPVESVRLGRNFLGWMCVAGLLGIVIALIGNWSAATAAYEIAPGFWPGVGMTLLALLYLPNIVIGAAAVLLGGEYNLGFGLFSLFNIPSSGPELPGLDVCSRPVGHRDRPDRQLVRRHSGLRDRAGLLARRGDDPPGAALPAEYRHRGGSRPAGRGVQPRLWPVQPVQYHQRGAAPAADPGRRPERAHRGWAVPAGHPGDRRRGHRLPLRAPSQLRGVPGLHGPGSRSRCLGAHLHRCVVGTRRTGHRRDHRATAVARGRGGGGLVAAARDGAYVVPCPRR